MTVILERQRGSQPAGFADLNRAHPLARYCTFLMRPDGSDAVSGAVGARTNTSWTANAGGKASLAASRAIGNGIDFARSGAWMTRGPDFTLVIGADLRPATVDQFNTLFCLQPFANRGSEISALHFSVQLTTNNLVCAEAKTGVTNNSATALAADTNNLGPAIYVVTRVGTLMTTYRNGRDVTNSRTQVNPPPASAGDSLTIHNIGNWVWNNTQSPMFFCAFIDGVAADASQVGSLSRNPWQLFAPQRIVIPYSSAPPPTLTGSLGQFDKHLRLSSWF